MFNLTLGGASTKWLLVATILAIAAAVGLLATQSLSAASVGSVKLWGAVSKYGTGTPTSPALATVEASQAVTLNFSAGDTAWLSSTPDGTGDILVDNFVTINGVNVCVGGLVSPAGFTNCFLPGSPLNSIPAIDVSAAIPIGLTTVVFEWRDFGFAAESSDVYLVTSAKMMVCHAPPGKASNVQQIVVGPGAAAAHLANHAGDKLGPC